MHSVLSQAEIDNLLKNLEQGVAGSLEAGKENARVRTYDFRRPNRFSKSSISLLSQIHDHFARQLSNFLTTYLRVPVGVKLATVDQVAFEDLIVSLPEYTNTSLFSLGDNHVGIINLGHDLSIPMIDLLCGGTGDVARRGRPISEMEAIVHKRLVTHMLARYDLAWQDKATLKCEFLSLETNPRLIQAIAPGEMVAVLTFTVALNKIQGVFTVCLPFSAIDRIINANTSGADGQLPVDFRERWRTRQEHLGKANIVMTAELGIGEISVRDFLGLRIGDVVALNTVPGDLIDLYVEDCRVFAVQPGETNGHNAVQVVATVPWGVEEIV